MQDDERIPHDFTLFVTDEEFKKLRNHESIEGHLYTTTVYPWAETKNIVRLKWTKEWRETDGCRSEIGKKTFYYCDEFLNYVEDKKYNGNTGYAEKRYDWAGNKIYLVNIDKANTYRGTIFTLFHDIEKYRKLLD